MNSFVKFTNRFLAKYVPAEMCDMEAVSIFPVCLSMNLLITLHCYWRELSKVVWTALML